MSNTSKKLKINVFGELWTLKKVALTPIEMEYYGSIAAGMNQPLYKALIDPFFYPKLKLENTQSCFDLNGEVISGATTKDANQVEIWLLQVGIPLGQFLYLLQKLWGGQHCPPCSLSISAQMDSSAFGVRFSK